MSRYTRTVLSLTVADAILVLFLTFGAVFPSRLAIPGAGGAMPAEFHDDTAKISPLQVPAEVRKQAKARLPVFSARSLPLSDYRTEDPIPASTP